MAPSRRLVKASEVQQHNKVDDIWIVVDGKVYDMTRFAPEHPGGVEGKSDPTVSFCD